MKYKAGDVLGYKMYNTNTLIILDIIKIKDAEYFYSYRRQYGHVFQISTDAIDKLTVNLTDFTRLELLDYIL